MTTTNTTTTLPAPAGVAVLTLDPRTGRVVCAGAVLIFEVRPGVRPAAVTVGGARFDHAYPEPWAVQITDSGEVDSPLGRHRGLQAWAEAATGRAYTIFGERVAGPSCRD